MKRYREYMNGIKASDTLHQRLRELEAPEKGRPAWKKYGAIAAALALVLGLGGFGYAHYYNTVVNPTGDKFLEAALAFDPAGHPDIAWEDPSEADRPGEKTLGGYDVVEGSGPTAMVTHYVLPYIEYGAVYSDPVALDWDIPAGAIKRDLLPDEIIALMGGEDAVNTHLDWGGYELSGWAAWYEDGSFWGAYIDGLLWYYGGPSSQFEFAVTAGQLPPTCVVYPGSVTQEIRGLTVTADKYDWELGGESLTWIPERRVSFFKGNCGYRFVMASGDTSLAEEMVSRLVCRIADEGLGVDLTDAYAQMRSGTCDVCGGEIAPGTRHFHLETYTCPDCGKTLPIEEEKIHVHTFVDLGEVDPDAPVGFSAAPAESAPPVSASGAPSAGPDEAMCSGYPVPPTPDPAGFGDICGLPLAPGGHDEGHP